MAVWFLAMFGGGGVGSASAVCSFEISGPFEVVEAALEIRT